MFAQLPDGEPIRQVSDDPRLQKSVEAGEGHRETALFQVERLAQLEGRADVIRDQV